MINGKTSVIGIVADPISHVKTPQVFNAFMKLHDRDAIMVPFHVKVQDFPAFMAAIPSIRNVIGLVITLPYKEAVLPYCTSLTDETLRVGAANVVKIGHEPRSLKGANFDGEGFVGGLIAQGCSIEGQRVYIAGAGGAAKAIAHALARHGAAAIGIYNRTESRAEQLVQCLHTHYPMLEAQIACGLPDQYTLAINSTSLGLKEGDALPFDISALPKTTLIAEVVMKMDLTPLLSVAKDRGHEIHFGRHMVAAQIELMARFLEVF